MTHKNIVSQTEVKNGASAFAPICFVIAALSVVASFIVAGAIGGRYHSAIEWMFLYFDAYMWFYIGAFVFIILGFALRAQKGGTLTVTNLYVCLETPDGLTILPIWNITAIRKAGNNLTITTANSSVQVGNVVVCDEIIKAVLAQMENQLNSAE